MADTLHFTTQLTRLAWPVSRLDEALIGLAVLSGLSSRQPEIPTSSSDMVQADLEALNRWTQAATAQLGIEAELIEIRYEEVQRIVCNAGPALLQLPDTGLAERHFLALVGRRRGKIIILGADLAQHHFRPETLRVGLCGETEAQFVNEVDQVLNMANVPSSQRSQARVALLRERLSQRIIGGGWLLRLSLGAGFWKHAFCDGLPPLTLAFIAVYILRLIALFLSWGVLGQLLFQGYPNPSLLVAWALLIATNIPLRLMQIWYGGIIAVKFGVFIKRRLLYGATRLNPEEIRYQGMGQHLARVIEAESFERFAPESAEQVLSHGLDLLITLPVLVVGLGLNFALLLLVWIALIVFIVIWYFRERRRWTELRLALSHDLIERMVGHQTRLAQELPEHCHQGEDQMLDRYLQQSATMDRVSAIARVLVPRGWLLLNLVGLVPALISGDVSVSNLAIGLGGILFVYDSLKHLFQEFPVLDTVVAWKQVSQLYRAASRPQVKGLPGFALTPNLSISHGVNRSENTEPIIAAHQINFRYRDLGEAAVNGCNLYIYPGERLLLQGPSGSGKSTLVAMLTGLRCPESGLLLCHGLDYSTLGATGWHRSIAAAPQFHENHILTGTFAFNLLMGRRWPPQPEDLAEAQTVCEELGLGDLLQRMPSGINQMVGETGWQLSHGERSRLYVARALLQGSDLVVLDESFAALDPETLRTCLPHVLKRAHALLIIAHP